MLTFNKKYFAFTALLFCIEVLIALYVHDDFVRPYIGDVLVVILIYCFVKSFVKLSVNVTAILVLLFAFLIEILQYVNIVEKLGLQNNKVAATAIGTSFAWEDFICYIVGIAAVLLAEKRGKPIR
ncbi:MAG: DUF2809 domain-containing protein [Flavobacterium sp.]|nr:MAG: DUF2809 domain-containing protein [Flavobacterium sp.]